MSITLGDVDKVPAEASDDDRASLRSVVTRDLQWTIDDAAILCRNAEAV